jgi:hypothetical protein
MFLYRAATCLIIAPPKIENRFKNKSTSEYFVTVNDKISRSDENLPWCPNSLNKSQRPVIKVWWHTDTAIVFTAKFRLQNLTTCSSQL